MVCGKCNHNNTKPIYHHNVTTIRELLSKPQFQDFFKLLSEDDIIKLENAKSSTLLFPLNNTFEIEKFSKLENLIITEKVSNIIAKKFKTINDSQIIASRNFINTRIPIKEIYNTSNDSIVFAINILPTQY